MAVYDFMLVLNAAFFAGLCALFARSRGFSVFHPVFFYLCFHGLVFVIRPCFVRAQGLDHIYARAQFVPSVHEKIAALIAANLALVTFCAVCHWLCRRHQFRFRPEWRAPDLRRQMRGPFLAAFILLAPIAVYSGIDSWYDAANDSSGLVMDLQSGVRFNTQGNGWFFAAQLMLVPLTAAFAWVYRFRWWSLLPFAGFVILRAGTGARGPFIVASAMLILLYLADQRRRWPEWRSALIVGAAAVLFNFVVADRGEAIRDLFIDKTQAVHLAPDREHFFDHPDFANLEMLEYAVHVVPQLSGGYDYFLNNLQILTEPIPRIWWKDKPLGPPIQTFILADYGVPYGFTFSIAGVGWMALGYLGVALQAGLFALIYGLLYRRLLAGNGSPFYLLFYTVMLGATVITFRDGTLLTIVRLLPFYGVPVMAVWIAYRATYRQAPVRRRRASGASSLPAERRRALAAQYRKSAANAGPA